ncbi:nucleoside/nucleotide kinase family protein [Thalassiella azotivora]
MLDVGPPGTELDLDVLLGGAARTHPRAGRTRVVAVDGRSGAGKTTLALELARRAGAPLVRMDELYPGWDGLDAAVPLLVDGVLEPLRTGRTPAFRRWDWARDVPGEVRTVPVGDVLVVEGVGCGAAACRPYLTTLLWLTAPTAVRHRRAMDRDGDGYRPHWDRWAAQEERYLATEHPAEHADVRVDTGTDGRRLLLP